MPSATRMPQDLTSLYTVRVGRGSQRQFYLIYVSSLICLMVTGWAATLLP